MAYSEILLDHFGHPRNVGELDDPDGEASITNPACGDIMRLQIRVRDEILEHAGWRTEGCSSSIAASSVASELIKGCSIKEAAQISHSDIAEALGGLPPSKLHSAVLVTDAVKGAIADYLTKHSRPSQSQRDRGSL